MASNIIASDILVVSGVAVIASVVWLVLQIGVWMFVVGTTKDFAGGRHLLGALAFAGPLVVVVGMAICGATGGNIRISDYLTWPCLTLYLVLLSYIGLRLARRMTSDEARDVDRAGGASKSGQK